MDTPTRLTIHNCDATYIPKHLYLIRKQINKYIFAFQLDVGLKCGFEKIGHFTYFLSVYMGVHMHNKDS